jgi:hypothetical protein
MRRRTATALAVASAGAGALAARFLDRSRRKRLRDQAVALPRRLARRGTTRAQQRTRYLRGVTRGRLHRLTHPRGHPPADDRALAQKVRSEVLGAQRFSDAAINVDAVDGTVTLRGQLLHPDDINELEKQVGKLPGVRAVENLVHAPGTTPANKRAARETT